MTPEQYQRVKDLYAELEPLSAGRRSNELAARCGDDPVVRSAAEQLLAASGDVERRLSGVSRQASAARGPARPGPEAMVGRRVGPYEVIGFLGRGGMGVVYLGRDTRLDRKAALKAVLPGADHDPVRVERLRREARVLASLSHPNLATVYGLEESDDTLYLVMEHVDGRTLSDRLGHGAMPIPDALQCCEQIAAGLEAAHANGVVHRDLKPANTMITAGGTVKLLDFGLARDLRSIGDCPEAETRSFPLTTTGTLVGTPAYMSPEQARCEPLDCRSDIFSFGAVLFRCLAGRPAFEGETDREVIDAILTRDPDWSNLPPALPAAAMAVVKRCLAKDPAERYRHVGDARLDLRDTRLARGWERSAAAPSRVGNVRRFASWAAVAVALAITAAVAGFGFGTRAARPAPAAEGTPQRFDLTFPADAVQGDLERLQLALAPDGRSVVVACKIQGRQALWWRSHGDGQWRPVAQGEGGHRPVFSADGHWVAFFRDGHLFKHRPTGGGDPIRVAPATNWYGATWADDGSLVYSAAWGDPLQALGPGDAEPRPCTRLDAGRGEVSHVSPAVIPGTRWVLFSAWDGGERADVVAAHLDGGDQHLVVANASSPRVARTPRGDYLLFERGSIVVAAPLDRTNARVTGVEAAVADGVMNDGTRFTAYFDVAADGTLAYVPGTSFAEESRLAYVSAGATRPSTGASPSLSTPSTITTPFNDDRMSFCEPVFAPRGNKLAVLVKGKLYRALVYDLDRGTRESILTGGDTLSLAVSPDGQTLACTVNRDGGYGIDMISLANGSRLGRVVAPGVDYPSDLSWSADGAVVAFSMAARDGSPNDIWLVEPVVGSRPRVLVSTPGADTKPAICPVGRWVAYQSDASGRVEVYLVAYPDGTTTRQVTSGGGARPAWSPDGRTLYFVGPAGLSAVALTPEGTVASQPAVMFDRPFGQSDPIAREYTVAPDGRLLIVEPSERRPTVSHLHVITNWYRLLP